MSGRRVIASGLLVCRCLICAYLLYALLRGEKF